MKKYEFIGVLIGASILAFTSSEVIADEVSPDVVSLNLASECTTNPVSSSGSGHTCYAENWTCQTAPENYVMAKDSVSTRFTSVNGPGARCDVQFSGDIEVIPGTGIFQPNTVCMRATAQSGSGMNRAGVRGWAKCVLDGNMTRFQE